jgi:MFS family permease
MTTSDRTQWPIVWLTVAGGIVAALHVGKISPALPALRGDLELSLVQGGFVVSMFYVLGMTLGMVVGVMVDRLGRRALIAAGFRSARRQRAAILPMASRRRHLTQVCRSMLAAAQSSHKGVFLRRLRRDDETAGF